MARNGGPQTLNLSVWSIVKVILVLLGFALLWVLRDVIAILFVSVLLSALIDPFAAWFAKRHIPRAVGVIIIYAILTLLAALVVVLLIPPLVEQSNQLISILGLDGYLGDGFTGFGDFSLPSLSGDSSQLGQFIGVFDSLRETVTSFVGGVGALVIVLVLTFYMVVEEQSALRFFKSIAPIEYQPYLAKLYERIQTKIGAWMRGQLLLGLVVGLITFIGLMLLGVKYALVLALIAGILEIVPYIGPVLAAIPAIGLTFLDSPTKGVLVLIFYILVQQVENNFLVPGVMKKATGLNPIISIIALVIGLQLGGIIGAIVAIPVATVISVIAQDLFLSSGEKL